VAIRGEFVDIEMVEKAVVSDLSNGFAEETNSKLKLNYVSGK